MIKNIKKILRWIPIPILLCLGLIGWYGIKLPSKSALELPAQSVVNFIPVALGEFEPLTNKKIEGLGKPSLLNVFASWCFECELEHKFLMYLKNKGFDIWGLNYWDNPSQNAIDWLKKFGNPYAAILIDSKGKVASKIGVVGVPETFLLDSKGYIRGKIIGPISEQHVRDILLPWLTEEKLVLIE